MTRRRSKVRSKTRSDSSQRSEDEALYCICRSSDGTRFMIACDQCEEWYHGDCINVTPKQANNIRRFFCHLCISRYPSLEIEYKTNKEDRPRLPNLRQQIKRTNMSSEDDDENDEAELSSSSSPDKPSKNRRITRKRWRPMTSESVVKKRRGRPKERHDEYDEEATEDEVETSGFVPMEDGHDRKRESCGNCEACKMTGDCGQCDVCQRYGPATVNGVLCRKKRCVRAGYRSQLRRSYHVSKDYDNSLIDDEYEGVVDGSEHHRHGSVRRRTEFEIGEIRQRLTNPVASNKDTCAVGSKMRRGDHLPGGGNSTAHRRGAGTPYACYREESLEVVNGSSYRYQQGPLNRLSRNETSYSSQPHRRARNPSDAAQMSSNTSSVSGPMSSHQYQYADDSDEDVMIPGEVISPTNGQRLADSDPRNFSSYHQQRPPKTSVNNDLKNHHYGLGYPDHLYCKHHRSFDWHGGVPGETSEGVAARLDSSTRLSDKTEVPHAPVDRQSSPSNLILERISKSVRTTAADSRHKSHTGEKRGLADSLAGLYSECGRSYQLVDLNAPLATEAQQHKSLLARAPSSMFPRSSSLTQEFYTINDEDDLEINWPKETVNV